MSKLLIQEPPLQVLPSLAVKIGLNQAMALQQLHFWEIKPSQGKIIAGRKWIRNTLKKWKESNFPFWSEKTIGRIFTSLEEMGLVDSRTDLNKHGYDRTKWYSSNHEAIDALDFSIGTTCPVGSGQTDTTIPENTTENTEEEKEESDTGKIFTLWQSEIGSTSPIIADKIKDLIDNLDEWNDSVDVFTYAIAAAVKADVRKPAYVEKIVNNIITSGLSLELYIKKRAERTGPKKNGRPMDTEARRDHDAANERQYIKMAKRDGFDNVDDWKVALRKAGEQAATDGY